MFFLIDLDGTLLKTDHLHYEAWAKVLKLNVQYVERIITTHGINYILNDYPDPLQLRKRKSLEMLKFTDIETIENMDAFVDFIIENNIEHVVVTNTNREVVEHFKEQVPILKKLKNWIVREDYVNPKPDPECYQLAIKNNTDRCIVGFENSREGLEALYKVTPNVFHVNNKTDYLKVLEHIKTQW